MKADCNVWHLGMRRDIGVAHPAFAPVAFRQVKIKSLAHGHLHVLVDRDTGFLEVR